MPVVLMPRRAAKKQIPAHIGFQATAGDNTLHLRSQANGYDCTIDWGDGAKTTAPANGGNVVHSYAAAGLYDIKIRGKSFAGFYVNNQAGKEKYVAAYSMGKWEVDTLTDCTRCFNGCNNLISISENLFKYNARIQDFNGCFKNCTSLHTIPADLFRYNTAATIFTNVFNGCTNLTILPTELFRNNTLAESFNDCFYGCSLLSTIPTDLFKYNTLAKQFGNCFSKCGLIEKIPDGLFQYNTAAITFSGCFSYCTSITTVPVDIFRYNTEVKEYTSCFAYNPSLKTIPADIFRYNTIVYTFAYCFFYCTNLTLRADIFGTDYANRFNGKTVNFSNCFKRDTFAGTQGTAPELWSFTGLTATKTSCFGGAGNSTASLTNYSSIPTDWKT